jgi:hypothetical protein
MSSPDPPSALRCVCGLPFFLCRTRRLALPPWWPPSASAWAGTTWRHSLSSSRCGQCWGRDRGGAEMGITGSGAQGRGGRLSLLFCLTTVCPLCFSIPTATPACTPPGMPCLPACRAGFYMACALRFWLCLRYPLSRPTLPACCTAPASGAQSSARLHAAMAERCTHALCVRSASARRKSASPSPALPRCRTPAAVAAVENVDQIVSILANQQSSNP